LNPSDKQKEDKRLEAANLFMAKAEEQAKIAKQKALEQAKVDA